MIEEALEVEQEIRDVIQEVGMDWILAAVDEAIAAGVPEEVGIIDRSRAGSRDEDGMFELPEVREVRPGSRDKPTRKVTKNRPRTSPERIELLLAALRRCLIDLPAVHDGLIQEINAHVHPERGDSTARSIHFEPDLDSITGTSLHIQVADEPQPHPGRTALRTKAEELLRSLQEEVGA